MNRALMISALVMAVGVARPVDAGCVVEGVQIIAESATLTAVLQQGTLVSLTNKLTGEEMLASGAGTPLGGWLADGRTEPAEGACTVTAAGDAALVTRTGAAGEWRLEVRIDAATGDLVMKAGGRAARTGVGGVRVAMAGPDWGRLRFAAPASAQGIVLRDPPEGQRSRFEYCGHRNWEAQFLVCEPDLDDPAGHGGFAVWSTDERVIPKSVELTREGNGGVLLLDNESLGAASAVSSADGVEWRVNVFEGDWRAPADRYREWMRETFLPAGWSPPEWASQIAAFVTLGGVDRTVLEPLSTLVDPSETLLVLPKWRRQSYDHGYPDYSPAEGFDEFVREAHRLGFRIMVHFNTFGCSAKDPHYASLEPFILRNRDGSPCGYHLDNPDHPMHFLHIHPGSSAFRRIIADAAREAMQVHGVDAIHLDQSLEIRNHSGGLVEGLTVGEGKMALIRDILHAAPGVALGGEEFNETTLALSFTQRTAFDDEGRTQHPIDVFLFGPSVKYYSHYAFTVAGTSTNSEAADRIRTQERSGIYPTFRVDSAGDLMCPGSQTMGRIAKAFQDQDLTPMVEERWPPDARFCWQSGDGSVWAVRPTETGAKLASESDLAYERCSGLDVLRTAGSIPGWPAFGDGAISGLDPVQQYIVSSSPPVERSPRFISVPAEHTLVRWQLSPDVIWADLEINRKRAALIRLTDLADTMRVGVLVKGLHEEPLRYAGSFQRQLVPSGGSRHDGFFAHPPWQGIDGWGQVFAEWELDLPACERGLFLDWFGGIHDSAQDTDGTTFIVEVDGTRVFERHNSVGGWNPMLADLTEFAGKRVRLRLITDPGPARNCSWDLTGWGDPIIREATRAGTLRILSGDDDLASLGAIRCTDGLGRELDAKAEGGVTTVPMAAPGTVLLRRRETQQVTVPLDLLGAGPRVGQVTRGEWLPSPAIAERADRVCAGVTRVASAGAHPPSFGQTRFQYLLKLPADPKAALELGYGVCGAYSAGVSFQVAVDRRTIWRDDMPSPTYRESTVPLGEYAGQDVLLELVTDSMGGGGFDWAIWGKAVLR